MENLEIEIRVMLKHFSYILLMSSLIVMLFAGCKKDSDIRITHITTEEVSAYYDGVVNVISEISSDGTPTIDTRGVCLAIHSSPTVGDVCVNDSLQMTGKYTCELTNLAEKTTYYVRAYASNKLGIIYGEEKSFTTPMIPKVSGVTVTDITMESAICNASIDYDSSITAQEIGFCYNTQGNPSIADSKATSSIDKTVYITLSPLVKGTKYYVRAYIVSNIGVRYGEIVSFETKTTPTIETSEVTNITKNSAVVSANITSDGGYTITERGVCYGESSAPTVDGKHVNEGTGVGQYSCTISGLDASKNYYARSYAKTENGIYFGNEVFFSTSGTPVVKTEEPTNVSYTSAYCFGILYSDGGVTVTQKGVCWNTLGQPTLSDNKQQSPNSELGRFEITIYNLSSNTTYYVRAYAINGNGVAYGEQIKFKTLELKEKCEASDYTQVIIGTQIWMAENYKCSIYDTKSEAYNASWLASNTLPTSNRSVYTPYYTDATDNIRFFTEYADNLTNEQIAKLGYLYNWAAAVGVENGQDQTLIFADKRQGICPNGWHIPTQAEWQTLVSYLGGNGYAGKKMKTTTGWYQNGNGTDNYGFAVLPSGIANGNTVLNVGGSAYFWTASPYYDSAHGVNLNYENGTFSSGCYVNDQGLGVRCLKD